MKETEVVAGELIEAGEDAPEVLEFTEKALDKMTFFVALGVPPQGDFIILTSIEAVGAGRDDRLSAKVSNSGADVLGVIAFVGQDELGAVVLEECLSVWRFMRLTGGEVQA